MKERFSEMASDQQDSSSQVKYLEYILRSVPDEVKYNFVVRPKQ
jgi:hypothetical protein